MLTACDRQCCLPVLVVALLLAILAAGCGDGGTTQPAKENDASPQMREHLTATMDETFESEGWIFHLDRLDLHAQLDDRSGLGISIGEGMETPES